MTRPRARRLLGAMFIVAGLNHFLCHGVVLLPDRLDPARIRCVKAWVGDDQILHVPSSDHAPFVR